MPAEYFCMCDAASHRVSISLKVETQSTDLTHTATVLI